MVSGKAMPGARSPEMKADCVPDTLMNRLYEGEVSDEQRAKLEQHIERCASCRERWESFVEGERLLEEALVPKELDTSACPDDETLSAYVDGALPSAEMEAIRKHVRHCATCGQAVLAVRDLTATWFEEQEAGAALATGTLELLARVSDVAEKVRRWYREEERRVVTFLDEVRLSLFEPCQLAVQRLAAETGEGFDRQTFEQPDSPFKVELVRFGREGRIVVTTTPEAARLKTCLVQVRFLEGEEVKLTRSILVKDGEGQCVLTPEEAEAVRPEEKRFRLEAQALVRLEQLEAQGPEAMVAVLSDLLKDPDPVVRRLSAEMLGKTGSPHALRGVREAKFDPDPEVREAAAGAEEKLSGGEQHGQPRPE